MDFEYLYIKLYTIVSFFKNNVYVYIFTVVSFFCFLIYSYVDKSLRKESSISYCNYIKENDETFLKNKQYGFYEKIRQMILLNSEKNKDFKKIKKNLESFKDKNVLIYERLYQLNEVLNSKDNEIYKSHPEYYNYECSELWKDAFITARILNAKNYDEFDFKKDNFPKYLVNFIQKGEKNV